jgi:hypothetical protein
VGEPKPPKPRGRESRTGPSTEVPGLIPSDPLPARVAILQVVLLFGIPLLLLALAKYLLHRYFPTLGY